MENLGRDTRTRRWVVAVVCVGIAAALPVHGENAGVGEVDVAGSWHLLIHYKDAASEDPDAKRWDDRLWRFERRGSRLQWSEFKVVVFDDLEGRFESTSGGRRARTLRFWEPNDAQLAEIRAGLRVRTAGVRSKGLRGDASRGFRSATGLTTDSVSAIGYSESWRVEGLPGAPVFSQDVEMGSGRTENLQGSTRYASEHVSEDGSELRGSFVRDGTRRGTFVMRRSGSAVVDAERNGAKRPLKKSPK